MYHTLAYGANQAAGASFAQLDAVTDPSFVVQNNAFIFYEPYELDAIYASGVSLTGVQLFDSTWNSINIPQVYPVNLSLTPPGNPQIMDRRAYPITIPQNEQVQAQTSNSLSTGNEYEFVLLFIAPLGQARPLPNPGSPYGNSGRVKATFTVTLTLTAGVWSAFAPVTFTNLVRGGTYVVVGVNIVMAHAVAVQFNFPRIPTYQGRKLYPGALVENAYGNVPLKEGSMFMGPLGAFDTTELFQLSALATASESSATYTGYVDLVYMGPQLLGQGGGAYPIAS